jgi:hypothetical protein
MAGVKITDLTPLATAASEDLLYIVDVSDISQSPQGTSKQIELGNLTASLDIDSGVFTPTASDLFALDSVTPFEGTWSRVGEVVTFGFYYEGVITSGNTAGYFKIDLPEILNDFTTDKSNSWVVNYDVSGYARASQNNGFQTARIYFVDYPDGAAIKGNLICIYKR